MSELEKIEKIYRCLESSHTIEQFEASMRMLNRYCEHLPENKDDLKRLLEVQEYALDKGEKLEDIQ